MNQHMPFATRVVASIGSPSRPELPSWKSRRVKQYIETNLDRPIRNSELAEVARLSRSHFCRAFHNSTGNPPHEYVIRRRIERAQALMRSTRTPLTQIALDCGLVDQAHLARLFRRVVGVTPKAWRTAQLSA
jgi:AraC family transcriptional regulator